MQTITSYNLSNSHSSSSSSSPFFFHFVNNNTKKKGKKKRKKQASKQAPHLIINYSKINAPKCSLSHSHTHLLFTERKKKTSQSFQTPKKITQIIFYFFCFTFYTFLLLLLLLLVRKK